MKTERGLILLFALMLMVSCSNEKKTGASSVEETETVEDTIIQDGQSQEENAAPEQAILPAVVLRDEASVWDSEDEEQLSPRPQVQLDMGTDLVYLGIDKMLSSGGNSYSYSKVRLNDGPVGWVSTFRLAKNAVSAVVVEQAGLYRKPLLTTPVNRIVPAGQIVAVSLEKGKVNGFAEVRLSYYEGGRISNPETFYIEYDKLSVSENDLDAARLTLKAFRNAEQQSDFFSLAASLGSIFSSIGSIISAPTHYAEPDTASEVIDGWQEMEIFAINPHEKGNAKDWYLVLLDGERISWVPADSAAVDMPPRQQISQRPGLDDKSHYRGGGVPSIGLYQGLSVRKLVKDEQGNESLAAHKFLEMGERVYASDREMKYDNIDFIYVDFPNEEGGWSSKAYIAADSSAAVVTEGDIRIFSEPKLTALTKLRLDKPQIVAVSNEKFSGFIKISYVDRNDGTLRRDVYAQSHKAFFSYDENDVNAAIFIDKILREEDEEKKELYLRKCASIPSSFQDELDDILFPPQQEDSPQEEPSAE